MNGAKLLTDGEVKFEEERKVDKINEDVKQKSESRSQMSKTNNE